MVDPINDASTAIDEPGWGGGGVCIDTSGDGMHITDPAERRAYKERSRKRKNKWARAQAIRDTWSEEDFAAEEARIAAQIEEWERARDAA